VTAASELRQIETLPTAPEHLRVSVVGGRTQLDVALPADVPIAAFLPELARLIGNRDAAGGEAPARDDRRTFWALTRAGSTAALTPEDTLRSAGVISGELLTLSARPALSPPVLYDDVVDAAARLNRASYAPWDASAAGALAFAGLWLVAAAWVSFLLAAPSGAHRGVIIGGAAATLVASIGGATLAKRTLRQPSVAAAVGMPALAVGLALGWVLAAAHGPYAVAGAAAAVLMLAALMGRLIGVGRWLFVAVSVALGFVAAASVATALVGRLPTVAVLTAGLATLLVLAVPALTARRSRWPKAAPEGPDEERDGLFENPFTAAEPDPRTLEDPALAVPEGDEVWARARASTALRTGLRAGVATAAAVAAAVLLRVEAAWSATAFALVCAAVLACRTRRVGTVGERAAGTVPALALTVFTCVELMGRTEAMRFTGLGILAGLAVAAAVVGMSVGDARTPRRLRTAVGYLDYLAVAAVVPAAVWVLGLYGYLW
jgi:type VII secretion integral membrane protein EccD